MILNYRKVIFTERITICGLLLAMLLIPRPAEAKITKITISSSWFAPSRAMKIQPYFQSGFPYGHDQWISSAATAWAVMGLAASAP